MDIELDSLRRRLDAEPDDRDTIPLLLRGSATAMVRDPRLALEWACRALRLAEQRGDEHYRAESAMLCGRALSLLARSNEAIEAFRDACSRFSDLGDRRQAASVQAELGGMYIVTNDYTTAFDVLSQSLATAEALNDRELTGQSLNRLGMLWYRLGDTAQALMLWQRCLDAWEHVQRDDLLCAVINNIANLHLEFGDRDRALEWYVRNLDRAIACGDRYREALARVNLAELIGSRAQYDDALQQQQRALDIFHSLNNPYLEGVTLSNIGRLYERLGRMDEALQYQERANAVLEHYADRHDVTRVRLRLGVLYRRLGRYDDSVALLGDIQRETAAIGSSHLMSKVCKQLSISYEHMGDYERALQEYREFMRLREESLHGKKHRAAEVMRMRHEIEQMSREREIYRIRNVELAGALEKVEALSAHYRSLNRERTVLFGAVVGKLRSPFADIADRLPALHARVSSADRATVQSLLDEVGSIVHDASRTVDRLLFAGSLEAGGYQPVDTEVDLADVVAVAVEELRDQIQQRRLTVQVTADACPVVADRDAVAVIVETLLANAVRFSPDGGRVTVDIEHHGALVQCRVQDEGPGISEEHCRRLVHGQYTAGEDAADRSFGLGLFIVRELIHRMNGSVRCEQRGRGACLTVGLPAADA